MQIKTFSLVDGIKVVGLSPSVNEEEVLITLKSRGVFLYDIFTKRCSQSFLSSSSTDLSTAVQSSSGHYYLISNSTGLTVWDDETSLQDSEPTEFPEGPIHKLYVAPTLDHLVVLFSSGVFALVDSNCNISQKGLTNFPKQNFTLIWSDLLVIENQKKSAYFLMLKEKNTPKLNKRKEPIYDYRLEIFKIKQTGENNNIEHISSHRFYATDQISTCAFCTSSLSFSVSSKTGSLKVFKFNSRDEMQTNNSLLMKHSVQLSVFEDKNGVGLVYLHPEQLVIVGHIENTKALLTVWDTNFLILQDQREIDFSYEDSEFDTNSLISVSSSSNKSKILLGFENTVVVCPLFCPAPSLATALGKWKSTKPLVSSQKINDTLSNHLNLNDMLEPKRFGTLKNVTDKRWKKSTKKQKDTLKELQDSINSKHHTDESFKVMLESYFDSSTPKAEYQQMKKVDILNDEKSRWKNLADLVSKQDHLNNRVDDLNNQITPFPILPHDLIVEIGTTCLENSFFTSLGLLIQHSHSCISIPQLIPTLIKNNRIDTLVLAALNLTAIHERDIIAMLTYFLTADRSLIVKYMNKPGDHNPLENCKFEKPETDERNALYLLLDVVFSMPINGNLVQRRLKALDLKQILELLEYIHYWLLNYRNIPHGTIEGYYIRAPTFSQILTWSNLIIDSHFARLVTVSDCYPVLEKIYTLVEENAVQMEYLLTIWTSVGNFLEKTPEHTETGDYVVEVLTI
eukprot:TRINITY_DN5601_c0_g1_i1.p1 TRINITY_DN5601_c0_g1~~TRINITY_DN5601_c0_g1_i1.p1  ORF type:complete len:738 (+),score=141.31 TRINITY_DN5601_c0_g1_i1:18-2231(+)